MPGGRGRPQKGMDRRNHNKGFGQSGQASYNKQPKPQRGNSGPSVGEKLAGYRYGQPGKNFDLTGRNGKGTSKKKGR